jgi:maltooligosyltrehalose trehalohydrolase
MEPGASVDDHGTTFRIWAPLPSRIELVLGGQRVPLAEVGGGWREARVEGVGAGARYAYLVDGKRLPDPASRAQPDGVHLDSRVLDPRAFAWRHPRRPRPLDEWIVYELHVGVFTARGTFDAAAEELGRLVELGVTAVELMPVASFPGRRNWGYDGVGWFAPQASYGGPEGLVRFVDAAHGHGLQVIADVVYNHFGPEGNYWSEFAPWLTARHTTPWGDALDFSRPEVRAHVLAHARMLADDYHVDGLRVDAVHAIFDDSPQHIVAELSAQMAERGVMVLAESDLGDVSVIEERPRGWGCDAQWADDLHHALHGALTGERQSYYADYAGAPSVARALADGFALTGEFSRHRGKPFGMPAKHLPGRRFVVCSQNHDQVGNRARGERLHHLREGCAYAAAAIVLLAPAVPLIFMGEEHADPAPFLYFTDHGDSSLRDAVREGRRREHGGAALDPQDPETFERSRIDLSRGDSSALRRFYRRLLTLRRERPALRALEHSHTDARAQGDVVLLRRFFDDDEVLAVISLGKERARLELPAPRRGRWSMIADAADFGGPAGVELLEHDRTLTVDLPPLAAIILGG